MSISQEEQIFCIRNPTIQNIKYFVYKGKRYTINFDLLVMNSKYFYKNQKEYENIESISLINDRETFLDITEETIEAFISSCQNQPFHINKQSVIPLQYLSIKYEFPSLTDITNEYIDKHSESLVFQTLLFKIQENELRTTFNDTTKEEEIISKDILKYINEEERMLSLPIAVLHRIICRYYDNNHQSKDKEENSRHHEIIEFLFKAIDRYGKDASILFTNIDLQKENISVMNRLLQEYSDKFDFNMINSSLLKTTTELSSDLNKQKEEIKFIFSDMQKELEKQKKEILEMKKEQIKQIEDIERRYQTQIRQMRDELDQIKTENKNQMEIIQKQFGRMIEKNEKTVSRQKIENIDHILYYLMNASQLKEMDKESQKDILKNIIENKKENSTRNANNKFIQKILCIHNIFEQLSKIKQTQSNDDNEFESEVKFILDNIEKPLLSVEQIEHLYKRKVLNPFIENLIKNYEYFCVELDYQSKSFDPIIQTFLEIKKSSPNFSSKGNLLIKIFNHYNNQENSNIESSGHLSINIKYHELEGNILQDILKAFMTKINSGYISKYGFYSCSRIVEISIPPSITSIDEYAFCLSTSLTQVTISSSVTSIGKYTFQQCTSLTRITIPSSVTSIGDCAFQQCTSLVQIAIPSSVTSIENHTFYQCTSLAQITIPSSVTSIGSDAFYQCTSLTQITIPSSVTSIGSDAFYQCTSLTQITIPSSVTSIGSSAFSGCASLKKVSIQAYIKYPSRNIFYNCPLIQNQLPSNFK